MTEHNHNAMRLLSKECLSSRRASFSPSRALSHIETAMQLSTYTRPRRRPPLPMNKASVQYIKNVKQHFGYSAVDSGPSQMTQTDDHNYQNPVHHAGHWNQSCIVFAMEFSYLQLRIILVTLCSWKEEFRGITYVVRKHHGLDCSRVLSC